MNILISEGGSILIDFEIAKESHVYVNNGAVDFYREWEELPAQDREKFLTIAELVYQTLNAELMKLAKYNRLISSLSRKISVLNQA